MNVRVYIMDTSVVSSACISYSQKFVLIYASAITNTANEESFAELSFHGSTLYGFLW